MGELEAWGSVSWSRAAPELHVRGTLPVVPGVCMVGSRDPTPPAVELAAELAAEVVARGWAVWSGGAKGIDRAAHEAALAAGGITVAVVAGPIDRPHPAEHAELYARIVAAGGALLSLQPTGGDVRRYYFVWRDQLMAGVADATVVIQARVGSGARHTAFTADRLKRPLFITAYPPWLPEGRGGTELVARGIGKPLIDRDTTMKAIGEHVEAVRLLGPARRQLSIAWAPAISNAAATAPLDPDAEAVLAVLDDEPLHVDVLCSRARLSAQRVSVALFELLVRGICREVPSRGWQRVLTSPR